MAKDPEIGYKVVATITDSEGTCGAGHAVGESLKLAVTTLLGYVAGSIMTYSQASKHFNLVVPYRGGMGIQLVCNVRIAIIL